MESNQEPDEREDETMFDEDDGDGEFFANGTRKPRRDSLQGRLTDEQVRQMEVWLGEEGRGYTEVRELMKA